ncbi:hypothetical protein MMPV_000902 [Pyropia vietnamensis]
MALSSKHSLESIEGCPDPAHPAWRGWQRRAPPPGGGPAPARRARASRVPPSAVATAESVREVYLRVIEATIAAARAEVERGALATDNEVLDDLAARWHARLTFLTAENAKTGAEAAAASAATTAAAGGAAPAASPPAYGGAGASGLGLGLPAVAAAVPPGVVPQGDGAGGEGDSDGDAAGRGTKRGRGEGDGGEADDDGDDPKEEALPATVDEPDDASLGGVSIDSDLEHRAEDEDESEDYILAQHDRVTRKSGKWKVQLKDGVVHVGGVDYLFNKGTADLNWA